jgi:CBS domain containing-hemolysin-like protein
VGRFDVNFECGTDNSEIENPTLLPDNTSAMKVFEELGNSITSTHRVLLINKYGDVQQLVSQSDCIRFIQTALERNFEIRVRPHTKSDLY